MALDFGNTLVLYVSNEAVKKFQLNRHINSSKSMVEIHNYRQRYRISGHPNGKLSAVGVGGLQSFCSLIRVWEVLLSRHPAAGHFA